MVISHRRHPKGRLESTLVRVIRKFNLFARFPRFNKVASDTVRPLGPVVIQFVIFAEAAGGRWAHGAGIADFVVPLGRNFRKFFPVIRRLDHVGRLEAGFVLGPKWVFVLVVALGLLLERTHTPEMVRIAKDRPLSDRIRVLEKNILEMIPKIHNFLESEFLGTCLVLQKKSPKMT